MGTTHTNNNYRDSNLVVEYYFDLNKPSSSQPLISEQIGASLHELEPLEQAQVCRELKHIITTTKPEMVSEYKKFQRINIITKILISIVTTTCLGYIGGAIMGYLPSLKLIWLLICTLTFILWMSLAIYILYFTKKITNKWVSRWRSSIMSQISTQTVEWQTKSKSFTFSVYYPITAPKQSQIIKSKSTKESYGGILRITLGMPKSRMLNETKEAVYFQVMPKESVIANKPWKYYQTSDTSDDEMNGEQDEEVQDGMNDTRRHSMYKRGHREHRRTATDELLLIGNGENTMSIKPVLHNQTMSDIICDPLPFSEDQVPQIGVTYDNEQQFAKVTMDDVDQDWNLDECKFVDDYYGDLYNEDQVELAIEGDDDEDDDEYDDGEYDGNNEYMPCKRLPIMIHDKNGPKILLKGIRTIFNGKEAILIDDSGDVGDAMSVRSAHKKSRYSMPISPVQPDSLYDEEENIVLPMVGTATFTAIQAEL